MFRNLSLLAIVVFLLFFAASASAQIDDICPEAGLTPGLDSPFAHVPYVYGKVTLKGLAAGAKFPNITVELEEGGTPQRVTVSKSGNYCFRRRGSGGNITISLNGLTVGQRELSASGGTQDRQDFEISMDAPGSPPATISAKYPYTRSDKTLELHKRAVIAAQAKKPDDAAKLFAELVTADPNDFIAWSELADQYFLLNKYEDANAAYKHALGLRIDYVPAWINIGQMRVAQKQLPAAIEIFKHLLELEPDSAKAYRLLGEAYLQNKQGSLGVEALNKAIELDPIGMAECHLAVAHLYELAGAKQMATKEYKAFLKKVPDYADRKRLEKFIQDNPE